MTDDRPVASGNPAAAPDQMQEVRDDISLRVRVAGRLLTRSWLYRGAAAATGLVAGWLLSWGRPARIRSGLGTQLNRHPD